ncbi:MAG: hypothetical protein HY908_36675 [Myxococcales bacterium]|nr:hypothetical protein [Myxococcales bacterium]
MAKNKTPITDPASPTPSPAVAEPTVSQETLEGTPARVLPFVRTIGTSLPVRAALMKRGYTLEEHRLGWRLMAQACGYTEGDPLELVDVAVRDAIAEIDAADEDLFRVVRATLRRHHPKLESFVLGGIGASTGTEAVLNVSLLLERLDALERAPEREATRTEDAAALATLASRGLDAERRAELVALVAQAQSVTAPEPHEGAAADAAATTARQQALVALRAWYEEWSEIARACIKRRDYLQRLGLAGRRSSQKDIDEPVEPPAPPEDGAAR